MNRFVVEQGFSLRVSKSNYKSDDYRLPPPVSFCLAILFGMVSIFEIGLEESNGSMSKVDIDKGRTEGAGKDCGFISIEDASKGLQKPENKSDDFRFFNI